MGAGKSTVARLLAPALGCAAVDTDQLVEGWAGRTVAQIFAQDGERQFREAETWAIAELARMSGPVVVSIGGGAVLSAANRAAMRELGTVVWLRARPATLAERVGTGHGRPLLAGGAGAGGGRATPLDVLAGLNSERRALYQDVADVIVDVDGLSAAQVARQVAEALAELAPGPARLPTVVPTSVRPVYEPGTDLRRTLAPSHGRPGREVLPGAGRAGRS